MGCILVLFPFLWIINVLCINFDFWNFDLIFSKMIDIGLFWSKITIIIIEITVKQLLLTKYGWNNPNWGRLGLTNPKLHFYDISGSSKFIVNINVQINVTRSIFIINIFFWGDMLVTMSSIGINNNWKYQKTANYRRTIPLSCPCSTPFQSLSIFWII